MSAQWSEHEARAVLRAWRRAAGHRRFASQRPVPAATALVEEEAAGRRARATKALAPPVRIVDSARGTPIQVILPSGHIVRVGRGFDEETFSRVIALLAGR